MAQSKENLQLASLYATGLQLPGRGHQPCDEQAGGFGHVFCGLLAGSSQKSKPAWLGTEIVNPLAYACPRKASILVTSLAIRLWLHLELEMHFEWKVLFRVCLSTQRGSESLSGPVAGSTLDEATAASDT